MNRPKRHVLDNGMRLLLEPMKNRRTVSLGIWLACGSRHEGPAENGLTHFAEHLLFKGTARHHWQELSRAINLLGGNVNACTSTDWVKLYATVVDRDLPEALALLAEMFLQSTFPEEEAVRERGVILEEIAQYEDVPEDLAFEKFTQALLLPHPAGRPVIGHAELVEKFERGDVFGYWQSHLSPERMILTAAGGIDEEEILQLCERFFGKLSTRNGITLHGLEPAPGHHKAMLLDRDLEQVNFCFGVTGPKRRQESRFAWALYDTILGGGTGSRLFDEVRERRGLAYSIGSSVTALHETGFLAVAGSTRPEHAATALEICLAEIEKLAKEGPTERELETARRQLERTVLMAEEYPGSRATVAGEREIYGLDHLTTEEVLAKLSAVTGDQVKEIAREVYDFGVPAACIAGPLADAPGVEKFFPPEMISQDTGAQID